MKIKERDEVIEKIQNKLQNIQTYIVNNGGNAQLLNVISDKIVNSLNNATNSNLQIAFNEFNNNIHESIFSPHDLLNSLPSYTRLIIVFIILNKSNFENKKSEIKKIESDVALYSSELSNLQDNITKLKEQKIDEVVNHAEKIEQFYYDFFETLDEENQQTQSDTIKEIALITKAINTEIKILKEKNQKPFHGDNGILKDIQTKYDDIISKETTVNIQTKAINSVYNDIVSKQIDETKEEKSYTKPSKKETLDSFFKEIKDLEAIINTQKSEYEKLNEDTKKLNTALEKAKTGYENSKKDCDDLAKEVKETYSKISKGNLIKEHNQNSKSFKWQYYFAMGLQILGLGAIFCGYGYLMLHLPEILEQLKSVENKIIFCALGVISSYIPYKMIASLHENKILAKKLAEEYNHKQSLINSVLGFSTTYKDDTDSKKILVDKMIQALERNPSDEISNILAQNAKAPHDRFVEKIFGIREDVVSIPKKIQSVFIENSKQTKTKKGISENTDENSQKEPEETQ